MPSFAKAMAGKGVNFGFNRGNLLSNEQGLLHLGERKEVAYIAILAEKDIRDNLFLEILHEAVILDNEQYRGMTQANHILNDDK